MTVLEIQSSGIPDGAGMERARSATHDRDHLRSADRGPSQPGLLFIFGASLLVLSLLVARASAKEQSGASTWQAAGRGAVPEAG